MQVKFNRPFYVCWIKWFPLHAQPLEKNNHFDGDKHGFFSSTLCFVTICQSINTHQHYVQQKLLANNINNSGKKYIK